MSNIKLDTKNIILLLPVFNEGKSIYDLLLNVKKYLNHKVKVIIVDDKSTDDSLDWIKKFIFWELEVIKFVGYDINFSDYVDIKQLKENNSYIETYDGSKKIPSFLLNGNISKVNNNELKDGLKVVGDFLNKSVLIPNNINYPFLRNEFIKILNPWLPEKNSYIEVSSNKHYYLKSINSNLSVYANQIQNVSNYFLGKQDGNYNLFNLEKSLINMKIIDKWVNR